MITIKNITNNTEHIVKPTVFPDGTQQVWKLPEDVYQSGDFKVIWHYENDGELITLLQLDALLVKLTPYNKDFTKKLDKRELIIPFLPYSRQDKKLSNETTFGLEILLRLLKKTYFTTVIKTFDVHNVNSMDYSIVNLDVNKYVQEAMSLSLCDLVCFPDKGASQRGYTTHFEGCEDSPQPSFFLSKTRDQSTGQITGMKCDLPLDLKDKKILIVDDICDGGRTFKEAAKVLKGMGATQIDLYVTHGIFSNGIPTLLAGGINHVYTTDSFKTRATLTEQVTVLKLEL